MVSKVRTSSGPSSTASPPTPAASATTASPAPTMVAARAVAARDIVLVVDDSPETLGFLTEALEAAGITVLVALDGSAALQLVEQITPDLILLDAVMPGIGGFETCRHLKQMSDIAHVPVIFMTGLSETTHVVKGLEVGGVDYLTKPIVIEELMARIRVHLTNAKHSQAARAALDAAGRFLLAVNDSGRLHWSTPQASKLLERFFPPLKGGDILLPAEAATWIAGMAQQQRDRATWTTTLDGVQLGLTYLGQIRSGEHLLRLTTAEPGDEIALLKRQMSLTGREAEVLLWVARGKSNKDVSEILHISPRTVNKHLEQIFEKLGVENRASATARTIDLLHRWGHNQWSSEEI